MRNREKKAHSPMPNKVANRWPRRSIIRPAVAADSTVPTENRMIGRLATDSVTSYLSSTSVMIGGKLLHRNSGSMLARKNATKVPRRRPWFK